MHGRYIGPLKELQGQTAILRWTGMPPNMKMLAQFDGKQDWRVQPDFKLKHPITGALLCGGWHEFDESDFEKIT